MGAISVAVGAAEAGCASTAKPRFPAAKGKAAAPFRIVRRDILILYLP
jgi:hypothetical protein